MEERNSMQMNEWNTLQDKQQDDDDEPEVDLWRLLYAVRKNILMIVISAVVCGVAALGYTHFFIPNTYTSSSMILILTNDNETTNYSDMQLGKALTGDYINLIKSRPVLYQVIENLGLETSYDGLRGKLSVTNQDDTRILRLNVVDTDPEMAKRIVDEVSVVASQYIGEKMEITAPKIIEEGEVPNHKTAPSNSKNAVIGAMIGLFGAFAFVVIRELINDTIVSEEDVERYLGLITLANVPMKPGDQKSVKRNRKRFF